MNPKLLMIASLMAALAACGKKGEEPATIAEPVKAEPVVDPSSPAGVAAASQKFPEVAQQGGYMPGQGGQTQDWSIGSSDQAGEGQPSAGQSQQGFAQGQPIDKVASVVKEKLVDWGLASPSQGQGQPGAGQQGQGSQQGSGQGRNPLQASFDAGQGQGLAQQTFGAGSGQGGQNVGQQGLTQGQQFHGQQGQSGQGSFQGGNYGQQSQGQSWQQGTSGANQQFQSGGTQGSSSQQAGSTSGSTGAEEEHMDSVEYYQELARRQYATLKQECDTLKKDPNVYEQCQTYAKSVRDKIAGMAEQGEDATQRSNQRGG